MDGLRLPTFGFECNSGAVFERTSVLSAPGLKVEQVSGKNAKTFTTTLDVGAGVGLVIITESGITLGRTEFVDRWYVMPPTGVALVVGERSVKLRVARGSHKALLVSWNLAEIPMLVRWLDGKVRPIKDFTGGMGIRCRSYRPHFASGVERLYKAIEGKAEGTAVPVALSVIAEAIAFLGTDQSPAALAPIPGDLQDPLKHLVDQVRTEPEKPWPLKEASEEVGYSPFHFSRIFKQQTGFGFHEFVDRTRTEFAVELLCSTSTPVDLVATQAGFGTTQGLRESVKEYLGLVPTELRSEPDDS